jgi:hypothetical protein
MNKLDLAWAAGLYEGEGSICARKDKPASAAMSLGMTDEDVVRRFAQIVGFGNVYPRPRANASGHLGNKLMWYWQTGRYEHVQAAIAMFWPWLGTRRRAQASRVLHSCATAIAAYRGSTLTWSLFGKARRDLSGPDRALYTSLVRRVPRGPVDLARQKEHRVVLD